MSMLPFWIFFANIIDIKNIARVRNCPDVPILNPFFGLFLVVVFIVIVFFVSSLKSHSLCRNSKVAVSESLTHSLTI